jgi:peptidoglycan-associated lipoprotein
MRTKTRSCAILCALAFMSAALGCFGKNDRPAATTAAPPPPSQRQSTAPPARTEPPIAQPSAEDTDDSSLTNFRDPDNIFGRTLDEINADSPLADIRFDFDSAVLLESAKATLDHHADWLKRYPSVTLLVEGHCDERGTVEYNLALGERRATVAYNYLMSLGIPATRLKTISYGKEFPVDPGHTEEAWARNRRAHFQITAK